VFLNEKASNNILKFKFAFFRKKRQSTRRLKTTRRRRLQRERSLPPKNPRNRSDLRQKRRGAVSDCAFLENVLQHLSSSRSDAPNRKFE
jgi:hypothetical protein